MWQADDDDDDATPCGGAWEARWQALHLTRVVSLAMHCARTAAVLAAVRSHRSPWLVLPRVPATRCSATGCCQCQIAGLANPGTIAWAIGAAESTATLTALSRHSVGAAAVDALAELLLAGTPGTVDDGSSASTRDGASRALAPQWARDKKLKARVLQLHPSGSERGDGEGDDGVARVILTKPTVFMNESGKSVGRSMRAFDVDVGRLCLVHDGESRWACCAAPHHLDRSRLVVWSLYQR